MRLIAACSSRLPSICIPISAWRQSLKLIFPARYTFIYFPPFEFFGWQSRFRKLWLPVTEPFLGVVVAAQPKLAQTRQSHRALSLASFFSRRRASDSGIAML